MTWAGGDCSERSCPRGKAWFDVPIDEQEAHQEAECSNRGICDRSSALCVCNKGFHGTACQYMSCPPGVEPICSGHGKCLSLEKWATETPNVYVREVMVLQCVGNQGTFTVTMRGRTSEAIDWSAPASTLRSILRRLNIGDDVSVIYTSNATAACVDRFEYPDTDEGNAASNKILVKYLVQSGPIAEPIFLDPSGLTSHFYDKQGNNTVLSQAPGMSMVVSAHLMSLPWLLTLPFSLFCPTNQFN